MGALETARERLFETCLAVSLGVHLLLWSLAWLRTFHPPSGPIIPALDVDITTPFRPRNPNDTRLPGAAKGIPAYAPKPTPGGTGPQPPQPQKAVQPVIVPPQAPGPTEKNWVLPGPNTKVIEKPILGSPALPPAPVGAAPAGTGPGGEGGRGGSGGGTGTGDAIVNRPPRLVNRDVILALLKSEYPLVERRANREGQVVVSLDIGADGLVKDVEVVDSAGDDFDEAAKTVARRMVFEPRLVRSIPTETKVKQRIVFQLGN